MKSSMVSGTLLVPLYSLKGAHLTSDQDAAPQLMEQVCRDYEQKHLKTTDVYSYMLYSD